MAHEYGTEPVWKTAAINEFGSQRDPNPRRHHQAYPQAEAQAETHSASDVASVLGLPVDHVTPEILAALEPLLVELDRLRFEHAQAERRTVALQAMADRHSVVPCLDRRAFMREMDSFLLGGGGGALATLHVGQVEQIRAIHGLAAGEGALRHVCAIILQELRLSDLVGCLGGSDFAVLLPGCDRAAAIAKLAAIAERINAPPFTWMGQGQILAPHYGIHEVTKADEAESALAAADRDRRGIGRT